MGWFSTCQWLLTRAGFSLRGEMMLWETSKGPLFHWDAHLLCARVPRGLGAPFPQLQTPHTADTSSGSTDRGHKAGVLPAGQHLHSLHPVLCQPHHTPTPSTPAHVHTHRDAHALCHVRVHARASQCMPRNPMHTLSPAPVPSHTCVTCVCSPSMHACSCSCRSLLSHLPGTSCSPLHTA